MSDTFNNKKYSRHTTIQVYKIVTFFQCTCGIHMQYLCANLPKKLNSEISTLIDLLIEIKDVHKKATLFCTVGTLQNNISMRCFNFDKTSLNQGFLCMLLHFPPEFIGRKDIAFSLNCFYKFKPPNRVQFCIFSPCTRSPDCAMFKFIQLLI